MLSKDLIGMGPRPLKDPMVRSLDSQGPKPETPNPKPLNP